jgi:hypothetical protein
VPAHFVGHRRRCAAVPTGALSALLCRGHRGRPRTSAIARGAGAGSAEASSRLRAPPRRDRSRSGGRSTATRFAALT